MFVQHYTALNNMYGKQQSPLNNVRASCNAHGILWLAQSRIQCWTGSIQIADWVDPVQAMQPVDLQLWVDGERIILIWLRPKIGYPWFYHPQPLSMAAVYTPQTSPSLWPVSWGEGFGPRRTSARGRPSLEDLRWKTNQIGMGQDPSVLWCRFVTSWMLPKKYMESAWRS